MVFGKEGKYGKLSLNCPLIYYTTSNDPSRLFTRCRSIFDMNENPLVPLRKHKIYNKLEHDWLIESIGYICGSENALPASLLFQKFNNNTGRINQAV